MSRAPEIRAVLDRSALLSYAGGHVHVGEIIREIADEQDVVAAIPALALLSAHVAAGADQKSRARLRVVTTLPGIVVADLDEESADRMAGVAVVTGDRPKAHAAWTANRYHALLLTTEPAGFRHLVPPSNVVTIPAGDA